MASPLKDAAAALIAAAEQIEELEARNSVLEQKVQRTTQLFRELNILLEEYLGGN